MSVKSLVGLAYNFLAPLSYDPVTGNVTSSGGGVTSIVAGTNISIDSTNPAAPIISANDSIIYTYMGGL